MPVRSFIVELVVKIHDSGGNLSFFSMLITYQTLCNIFEMKSLKLPHQQRHQSRRARTIARTIPSAVEVQVTVAKQLTLKKMLTCTAVRSCSFGTEESEESVEWMTAHI